MTRISRSAGSASASATASLSPSSPRRAATESWLTWDAMRESGRSTTTIAKATAAPTTSNVATTPPTTLPMRVVTMARLSSLADTTNRNRRLSPVASATGCTRTASSTSPASKRFVTTVALSRSSRLSFDSASAIVPSVVWLSVTMECALCWPRVEYRTRCVKASYSTARRVFALPDCKSAKSVENTISTAKTARTVPLLSTTGPPVVVDVPLVRMSR
mmetsp:Transcript_46156/g.142267  ORF Transcript_46156/g.142267 Transcript_46156/m.142267 type:complete len:218 (-) Transcript_46156:181-834(-)